MICSVKLAVTTKYSVHELEYVAEFCVSESIGVETYHFYIKVYVLVWR